mgnify:CR=1 FL=1
MEEETAGLTVRWEESGELVVEELAKVVLAARGGWATVAFLAREKDKENGGFEDPKVIVRRYRRRAKGGHEVTAKLSLSMEQARALADAVTAWSKPG